MGTIWSQTWVQTLAPLHADPRAMGGSPTSLISVSLLENETNDTSLSGMIE